MDGAARDLNYYEMRWILKFSFKHHLMNENKIFFSLAYSGLNDISSINSLKAVFTF
jgi:hypothetical protein